MKSKNGLLLPLSEVLQQPLFCVFPRLFSVVTVEALKHGFGLDEDLAPEFAHRGFLGVHAAEERLITHVLADVAPMALWRDKPVAPMRTARSLFQKIVCQKSSAGATCFGEQQMIFDLMAHSHRENFFRRGIYPICLRQLQN